MFRDMQIGLSVYQRELRRLADLSVAISAGRSTVFVETVQLKAIIDMRTRLGGMAAALGLTADEVHYEEREAQKPA